MTRLWQNNKLIKKFLGRTDLMSIFTANIILIIAVAVLTLDYVAFLKDSNTRTAELSESFVNISFQQLDSVLGKSEDIIKKHNLVLKSDFRSLDPLEKVEISDDINGIFMQLPYIEEMVMYKDGGDYFITSQGAISESDFFTDEFFASQQNIGYWNNIMNEYRNLSIIPVENNGLFSILSESKQKYFVVPKPYSVYGVGVLIFINESKFLDFCGVKYDSGYSVTFYDREGIVNITNAQELHTVDFQRLVKNDYYVKNNLFGNFEYTKWFNNQNMVYQFVVKNRISSDFIFIITLCILIIIANIIVFTVRYYKIYKIPMTVLKEIDYDVNNENLSKLPSIVREYHELMSVGELRKIVLEAMINNRGKFYHKSNYVNVFFAEKTKDSSMVTAIFAFKEVFDKRTPVIDVTVMQNMAGKYGIEMFVFNSIDSKLCALLTVHNDGGKEEKINKFFREFISTYEKHGKTIIIKSGMFNNLSEFADVYDEVLNISENTGINDYNCVSCIKEQSLININDLVMENKNNISRILYSGTAENVVAYISELFDTVFENNISFKDYKLFAQIVYSQFVEAVSEFIADPEQITNANQLFFEKFDLMCEAINVFGIKKFIVNLCNMLVMQMKNPAKDDVNVQIMQYVNSNYKNDIYLEKVADYFGYTKKYLSYYFKHEFNVGFNEYITKLRINEAKRLLTDTETPVSKIFSEVGYANQTTFNVAFKKITGTSPGDYRKRIRTKN